MYSSGCEKQVISMVCAAELPKVCCPQAFVHVPLVLTPPLPVQWSIIESQICQGWFGVGAGENKDGEGHVTQMLTSLLIPSHSCFLLPSELPNFMLELALSTLQLITLPSKICVYRGRHGRHSATRQNWAKSCPEVLSQIKLLRLQPASPPGIHPQQLKNVTSGRLAGWRKAQSAKPSTNPPHIVQSTVLPHTVPHVQRNVSNGPLTLQLAIRMPMRP